MRATAKDKVMYIGMNNAITYRKEVRAQHMPLKNETKSITRCTSVLVQNMHYRHCRFCVPRSIAQERHAAHGSPHRCQLFW